MNPSDKALSNTVKNTLKVAAFFATAFAMYGQALFATLISDISDVDNDAVLAAIFIASMLGKLGVVFLFSKDNIADIPEFWASRQHSFCGNVLRLVSPELNEHVDPIPENKYAHATLRTINCVILWALTYAATTGFSGLTALAFDNPNGLDAGSMLKSLNATDSLPSWLYSSGGAMYYTCTIASFLMNAMSTRGIWMGFKSVFAKKGFIRTHLSCARPENYDEFNIKTRGIISHPVTTLSRYIGAPLFMALTVATCIGFYNFFPIDVPATQALDTLATTKLFDALNPSCGNWGKLGMCNPVGLINYLFLVILGVASAQVTAPRIIRGIEHLGSDLKKSGQDAHNFLQRRSTRACLTFLKSVGSFLASLAYISSIVALCAFGGLPVIFQDRIVGFNQMWITVCAIVASGNAELVPFDTLLRGYGGDLLTFCRTKIGKSSASTSTARGEAKCLLEDEEQGTRRKGHSSANSFGISAGLDDSSRNGSPRGFQRTQSSNRDFSR